MALAIPAENQSQNILKFANPDRTLSGAPRAGVAFESLRTLWFNTGSLCNLACDTCYIESSPRNDRLAYLTLDEVRIWLDDVTARGHHTREIGFTGGEPFMNPDLVPMLRLCLERGYRVLVLTNAMRPLMKQAEALLSLVSTPQDRLTLRVSLDHYTAPQHEHERGPRSWRPAIEGLQWLCRHGFTVHVAGRLKWNENEADLRAGYARLFADIGAAIDARDPTALTLLPDIDAGREVPEITESCWETLGVAPQAMMCASSRMVIKRKGADRPVLVPCTLLPYDTRFDMGDSLARAEETVKLNHPHCASFCVLGGGVCSAG